MKRWGNLIGEVADFGNLIRATRKAQRGSRKSPEAAGFVFNMEKECLRLREELLSGTWEPAAYRYFSIQEPKYRIISAASFADRVVHHALVNVLEPIYEKVFIYDSYATRKEKGVHKARERAQMFLRKAEWFLKADVQKYFDSIDHDILLSILCRKIKDEKLLAILEKIIRHGGTNGKGLPIGNLTSQFLANVYLDPFDHFVKETLCVQGYIRYMDDWVIFSEEKAELKTWKKATEGYLHTHLQLTLNPSSTFLNQKLNGLSYLGARIYPGLMRIHRENFRRVKGRLRRIYAEYNQGYIPEERFIASLNSYEAYLEGFDTAGLRKNLWDFLEK
ncbi:MAG: reverse transcriptase/maturase family protein [Bacteroidia bacterium]|nr:reverse transcriptase/maturase family protein [Bacteroidia bacterium]